MNSKSLLENGSVRLKVCRYGPTVYLITDQFIGQSLDLYGEFSEGELELLRQVIRPGNTVLEVGANMGSHTVSLARATGPTGLVIAFEPQRLVFQILCANIALSTLTNVFTHHVAVGREAGTVMIPMLDPAAFQNFGSVAISDWHEGDRVSVMTIDSLNLSACHLIKIDVEGMESDVIAGAEQTIRRFKPVLYMENDKVGKTEGLIRQLQGLGYRLYWHLPAIFNPHNYFGATQNIFGGIVSANMLGIHSSYEQDISALREILDPKATFDNQ